MIKRYLLICIALLFLIVTLWLNIHINFNKWTKYCPYSHFKNIETSCKVLDQRRNRVLILHFNFDNSKPALSIKKNNEMIYIKHPETMLELYPEFSFKEDTIFFDPYSIDSLIFNNQKVPIVPITN